MHTTGMSFKAIGRQMGYHYTVVNRLVRKHTQTNNVKDLCRSTNSGRLMTLLDLNPADFRLFLTDLVDRRLLGSQCCLSTGLVANGIRLTKRCIALSSRSDVTRGLPDCSRFEFGYLSPVF
jgi:hypothetical protein